MPRPPPVRRVRSRGQLRPCRTHHVLVGTLTKSTLTPTMPRQRSHVITASRQAGFRPAGILAYAASGRRYRRWQARYPVPVECCQSRSEVGGLWVGRRRARPTQDTVNLVEWVIGDADDWMTDFAVAGVVVFAVFGASGVAQLLLHGAARPRGDRHRPARAPTRAAPGRARAGTALAGPLPVGCGRRRTRTGLVFMAAWRPSTVSHPPTSAARRSPATSWCPTSPSPHR